MSAFDVEAFLDTTTTEANTRRPPLPATDGYYGILGLPKFRQFQGTKDPSKTYTVMEVPVTITGSENPAVAELGINAVTVGYQIFVDMTPIGGFDTSAGRNGNLRRLREATDLNTPGESFSPRLFEGKRVRVAIKHEPNRETGDIYDRVEAVAHL